MTITYKDGKHYTGKLIIEDHNKYTKITNKRTKKTRYIPQEEMVDKTYLLDESHLQKTYNKDMITNYYDFNRQKTSWKRNIITKEVM
ncbi:hypothetical protein GF361_01095 [Candidatus Woesearchaeota archaeon]|nr:hypothetical protein [Candidatus Woesearchaeota archaeon]